VQTTQRLSHPLAPAVGLAVVAATGLAVTAGLVASGAGPGPAVGGWWVLVGLTTGYSLSGSV
jgi:hypothetical protein